MSFSRIRNFIQMRKGRKRWLNRFYKNFFEKIQNKWILEILGLEVALRSRGTWLAKETIYKPGMTRKHEYQELKTILSPEKHRTTSIGFLEEEKYSLKIQVMLKVTVMRLAVQIQWIENFRVYLYLCH